MVISSFSFLVSSKAFASLSFFFASSRANTLSITSLTSNLWNRISHLETQQESTKPKVKSDKFVLFVPKALYTLAAVSGIAGSKMIVPKRMASSRLYNTFFNTFFFVSSLANTQGCVSSIYLLALLNAFIASSSASATLN